MRPTWLTWINPDDHRQISWARDYLIRNGFSSFDTSIYNYRHDGVRFIEEMVRNEDDPAFRRCTDKMRAAWRQKQYRARHGQQTTFQLPHQVRADLTRLAKARRKTKVQALRELISDAANQHQDEKKKVKEINERHKKSLDKLENQRTQEVEVYQRLCSQLQDALAKEIHQRCQLEANVNELGDPSLERQKRDTYNTLVKSRVVELEASIADLKIVRPGSRSLRQQIMACDTLEASHPKS
jgi:predicted DNA-binding protein